MVNIYKESMEECLFCNFSSNSKEGVDLHLQKVHKKFVCEFCQALLSSLKNLVSHKYFAHSYFHTQQEDKQEKIPVRYVHQVFIKNGF